MKQKILRPSYGPVFKWMKNNQTNDINHFFRSLDFDERVLRKREKMLEQKANKT